MGTGPKQGTQLGVFNIVRKSSRMSEQIKGVLYIYYGASHGRNFRRRVPDTS